MQGADRMQKPLLWVTFHLPQELLEPIKSYMDVKMWQDPEFDMPQDEFEAAAQEADILWTVVSNQVTADVIKRAPKLKMIANLAVGYNNIDIEAATEAGIIVTNTPDVLADTTADLAFLLMMMAARRTLEGARALYQGQWKGWQVLGMTGIDIHHKTLGIIGMGTIGELVAKRATGFDMNVIYHNRHEKPNAYGAQYRSKEDLLREADFIIVLTPLTPATRNLITREELALMKKSAMLINVARGGIVNEDDLYEALIKGDILAAASDVFVEEPVPTKHPLLTLANFTALPHLGSATVETRLGMVSRNIESLLAYFNKHSIPFRVV